MKKKLIRPTDAEDRIITAAARSDSDNPPLTEAQLAQFKRKPGQRGPQKSPIKTAVKIRLSPAVVEYYKASGPRWQSRINDDLLMIASKKR